MNETPQNNSDAQGPRPTGRRPFVRRSADYRTGARPMTPRTSDARPHSRPSGERTARTATDARPTRTPRKSGEDGGPKRRARSSARPRRSMTSPALTQREFPTVGAAAHMQIQPVTSPDITRFGVVSGAEGIGRNMYFYEDKDDIVIFDCGLQFVSPEQKAPGVNYILPNTQYLESVKQKIRGVIITHGHLDHIGGIPFLIDRLGYPPIYTQYLTSLLVMKRNEEFPHLDPITMNVVKEGESFTVGNGLNIKTFPVTHSIPDAMGVMVRTQYGNFVFTGDVRLDHDNEQVVGPEKKWWEEVGEEKNLVLIADSTNCDRHGFSQPESVVHENLEKYVRDASGRIIIGTFASQFDRLIKIVKICESLGKVVVLEGRSLKTNIDIAITSGLLTVKPGVLVSPAEAEKYPRDRVVILATGAQGEEFAAMARMASGKHKFFTIDERDTVILSSSVIPGNELSVQSLKDKIFRNNPRVVTYQGANVHSSGHGYAGEMNWIRNTVKPKYLIPIHGNHFHLKSHMQAATQNGFARDHVAVPDNGSVIEFHKGEMVTLKEKMPNEQLTVDGVSVGVRQEVVLRDRLALAEDGMFVVVATLDPRTGKLRKSPDIISRGFIYLRENQTLLNDARSLVRKTIEAEIAQTHTVDIDALKDDVTNTLTKFLLVRTNKTPMVIPVIIGF